MNLEELKYKIETNNYNGESFIINNYDNCPFLVHQYIQDIVKHNGFEFMFPEDLSQVQGKSSNFLSTPISNYFYVYYTDDDKELRNIENVTNCCIVYTGKKLKDTLDIDNYIINIPKIEDWQIKDYVYTRGKGVNQKSLDYLINLSKNDLWRLEKELDKIEIFDEKYRDGLFNQFVKENVFSDLSEFDSFKLIDAIVKRNPKKAFEIYYDLNKFGLNKMGVIMLLYNNFRNIIKIQLSPQPTPENTGLKSNQFWAIKKNNVGFYHKNELLYIFWLITDMDRKIKTGEIPTELSVEYLLIKIFGGIK